MQILTVVMIAVSIICLLALILMHCVFSSLRTLHGKNLMAFSTSLLTAQILFLLASYIAGTLCVIIAISQHYFWLCSFMWTSVMAFDLASKFGAKTMMTYKTSTFHFRKTFIVAHGLPLILVVSCVVVDSISSTRDTVGYGTGSGGYCWIENPMVSLFVFGIPIALCLIFNMICFGISLHGLHGTKLSAKTVRSKKQERNYCIIYTKISILLGGTWIFGFLSAVINIKPILYMNICLNGLQGFFLFLGFILNARVIRMFRKQRMTTSSTISLPSSGLTDITRSGPSMTTDQRF
ncbi:latrophilin receptor-like protein A [Pecten maximus]|uniref:latrophilin receptor-like protein A n=1 Tax=Pecten maximus TaxID=6579 RepID=UPI0014581D52|nr:latrophilin receptor-like protein A [Pecten maximus]